MVQLVCMMNDLISLVAYSNNHCETDVVIAEHLTSSSQIFRYLLVVLVVVRHLSLYIHNLARSDAYYLQDEGYMIVQSSCLSGCLMKLAKYKPLSLQLVLHWKRVGIC